MTRDELLIQKEKERPVRQTLANVLRHSSNLKCLILTFLIHGCLVAIIWCRNTQVTKILLDFDAFPITWTRQVSPCDDGVVYIPTAFVVMLYLLYLVECWHSKARIQLSLPKTDVSTVYRKVKAMREAQPIVWWKAICYHHIRRLRQVTRYRNGGSYTSSQVFYERVNSHAVASYFFYSLCGMRDVSRELVDLEKFPATKIRFSKGFIFANEATAADFEEQRSIFFQDQGRLDDYMEMRESLELSNTNFQESLIAWASPESLPWFARNNIFWISSFLLLSWPIRILLELNTAHLNYRVIKLFGTNFPSNPSCLHHHRPLLCSNYLTQAEDSRPRRTSPSRSEIRLSGHSPQRLTLNRPPTTKISTNSLPDAEEEVCQKKKQNWRRGPVTTILPRSVTMMILESGSQRGRFRLKGGQNEFDFESSTEDELIPTYSEALLMDPPFLSLELDPTTQSSSLQSQRAEMLNSGESNYISDSSGTELFHESETGNSTGDNNNAGGGRRLLLERVRPRSGVEESGSHDEVLLELPPSYLEALRTSRPVFFPPFARLRRCLTERDLTGRRNDPEREVLRGWLNSTSYFLQRMSRIRLPARSARREVEHGSNSDLSARSLNKDEESNV